MQHKSAMDVMIIDDEPAIRNTIGSLLNQHFPEITITGTAGSVSEGSELLMRCQPDLLFLDVELPDGTGFDLLRKIPSKKFRVIFVTAHQEYALNAIKVSALDYLLKPVDENELITAVEKAGDIFNHEDERVKIEALEENLQSKKILKRIVLRTAESLQLVSVSEIVRAEAESNYTRFFLHGNRRILVSRTIKEFEAMLTGSGIIRVHQSHLVNIDFVDKFIKRDGGYLQLKDSSRVPVSPILKKQVLDAIDNSMYR